MRPHPHPCTARHPRNQPYALEPPAFLDAILSTTSDKQCTPEIYLHPHLTPYEFPPEHLKEELLLAYENENEYCGDEGIRSRARYSDQIYARPGTDY